MIELQQITVQFGTKQVLQNISMTFHKGEIIGLVAPNGTGKSTLMNVMMNYVKPHQGRVILQEKWQYTTKKNEVYIHQQMSMMPDQSDLYPHLSGKEHLKMYSVMWGSSPSLIEKTIEQLGMASYVNKKTGTYSLGMRQRLCFAMQIVADTSIMLMDEVMNGLDPTHVELISQILLQKKAEGKTIIIASHLLENLEKYADRIFFLVGGQLQLAADLLPLVATTAKATIRMEDATTQLAKALTQQFVNSDVQTLPNGTTLCYLSQASNHSVGEIIDFLQGHQVTNIHVGPITLQDLYSLYFQ